MLLLTLSQIKGDEICLHREAGLAIFPWIGSEQQKLVEKAASLAVVSPVSAPGSLRCSLPRQRTWGEFILYRNDYSKLNIRYLKSGLQSPYWRMKPISLSPLCGFYL